MKKIILKRISLALVLIFTAAAFAGCGNSIGDPGTNQPSDSSGLTEKNSSDTDADTAELTVSFGDSGNSFILHLYDNDTARAVARHVGTADWRLPIYHYDDYENWEVMQYYDIPSPMKFRLPLRPLGKKLPEPFTIPSQTGLSFFMATQKYQGNIRLWDISTIPMHFAAR